MNENKPKKVLIFSLVYFPEMVGGAEVAIKQITDRILSEEIEFHMITLRLNKYLPKKEKIGNIEIHRIGFTTKNPSSEQLIKFPMYLNKILFPVLAFWKAVWLDRRERFDGFWSMMAFMGFPAVFFRILIRKVPYVLTLQEGDDLNQVVNWRKLGPMALFLRKVFQEATVIQAISKYLALWARRMGYTGQVEIIPNGVDPKKFNSDEVAVSRTEIRNKYAIGDEEKLVITTSRLVHKNGVDVLIRALAFLPDNVKLFIVGDGPLRVELENLVAQEKMPNRVIFAGFVSQEKIPLYLVASDIFARPSRSEGQGISFLEAMAASLPVIGTAVGGIPDFLEDGKTGFIAKTDDPEDLALKIKKVLSSRSVSKIKKTALETINNNYVWEKLVNDMKTKVFSKIS